MIQIRCKDKMTDIVTWLVTVSLLRARSDKFKKKVQLQIQIKTQLQIQIQNKHTDGVTVNSFPLDRR